MSLILDGTNGLSDVDGTAATPAIRGTDTNTGIFFPAADTIAFAEGGTEVARFDSSGNLLVGSTTSTALSTGQLQLGTTSAASSAIQMLSSTSGTCGTYFGDGTTGDLRYRGGVEYDNSGDSLRLYSASVERMRIDSSGRVTAPSQPSFHVRVNNANYITTSPIQFTNVVFDVGSNFNTSTYRFTAPTAGKYYLVLNIYVRLLNGQDGYPRFRVNGTNVQYSYGYNEGTGGRVDMTLPMNRIFNLSAGDYVDVTWQGGSGVTAYYAGNEETNFYGWLIG